MKKTKQSGKRKEKKEKTLLVGEFVANERGYGFVSIAEKNKDVFIARENVKDAMNGDTVAIKMTKIAENGKREEGRIVDIIKRNITTLVGTYTMGNNFGFVIADDKHIVEDIYIPKGMYGKAKKNDKVVVEIIRYPEKDKKAEGRIIEILGKSDDPKVDLLTILRTYDYKLNFPKRVIKEVKEIPQVITSISGRVDLRKEEIFTIDGDDTKDIDDAVSIKKKGDKYILGVHIADVSSYVIEGTELDKEAIKRGTSVYLIDSVIPMLPKELSNGICSLNPNEDRYALSVEMEITKDGEVTNSKIYKSVIKSKIQMTYNKVYRILEKKEDIPEYKGYVKSLKLMRELTEILAKKRDERGSIDFNLPEAKIILDENRKAIDVKIREMTIANKIIEEFMILANETIARTYSKIGVPFIYRIHEKPDEEKINKLNIFLNNLNYKVDENIKNYSRYLKEALQNFKGKEEEKAVATMILRTMKLAKYSNQNIGHFGLTSEYYCHFTSPIRRYPDLFIHRMISYYLDKKITQKNKKKYINQSINYAEISSNMERMAEEAERDLEVIKKCEYMEEHIGQVYTGIISSVTSFGLFVELENTVEGFIHIENMKDDYYIFDEYNVVLVGERNKKTYKMGDKIKVKVKEVNKILRRIDFSI